MTFLCFDLSQRSDRSKAPSRKSHSAAELLQASLARLSLVAMQIEHLVVMQGRWTLLHVIRLVVWQKHVKSLSQP